ncbi:MAG: M48 family metalloprotease [Thermodesulfovibrionales bacterium]
MILKISIIITLLFTIFLHNAYGEDFRKRLSQTSEEEAYKTEDDIKAEIIFGRSLSERILGRYPLLKDRTLTEYINLIGRALAQHAGRPEIEFHFGILDTDKINAFSAPGGYIFITKGALMAMDDEAELAGVLGHEIAHVTERHIVKEINLRAPDESPLLGFASLISGATGSAEALFTTFIDKAYEILFERGYKREDELSSDTIATGLLATTGYDSSGLLRFLKRLLEKGYEKEIQGTHPGLEHRIREIEQFINKNQLAGKEGTLLKDRFYEKTRVK